MNMATATLIISGIVIGISVTTVAFNLAMRKSLRENA